MSEELVFVVDENNNPIKPLPRSYVIKNGLYRRVSSVTIINPETKEVLCQKRSEHKDERPGLWIVNFGGKAAPNENGLQTARREVEEELGLTAAETNFEYHETVKSEKRKQFEYIYHLYWQGKTTDLTPDPEEVAAIAWFDIGEAIKLLKTNPAWYSYDRDEELLKELLETIR